MFQQSIIQYLLLPSIDRRMSLNFGPLVDFFFPTFWLLYQSQKIAFLGRKLIVPAQYKQMGKLQGAPLPTFFH